MINELRIGNMISYFDNYVRVTEIKTYGNPTAYYISGIGLNGYTSFGNTHEAFKPIPLSSEILGACGFKKQAHVYGNDTWYLEEETRGADFDLIHDETGVYLAYESSRMSQTLQFLHQLQNLFFSLTGSELMIDDQKLKRSVATTAQ